MPVAHEVLQTIPKPVATARFARMPELPEVEVTRRSFASSVLHARIEAATLGRPLRWPLGVEARQLTGQHILGVRRRGKYLLMDLDAGILLLHLGMSGSLRFAPDPAVLGAPGRHDHFDLVTSQGTLRLHDPRRFGAVVFLSGEDDPLAQKLLGRLGVEPLGPDFDAAAFHAALQGSRSSIKALLLAGRVVVGVGNIYACEALFAAGIHPATPACSLGLRRARRLHAAIREVLERAVALGGSTLRDFHAADGQDGHFQLQTHVYGRAGQACTRCASPIRLLRQGQRSSFYCPRCQRG